jgi:hypothetical protein
MRAHSGRAIGAALALMLLATVDVFAHRTEDCLQAARIDVEPDRVLVTLDLTPGAAVADSLLAAVDGDGDGSLSADEQAGYAAQMAHELRLEIDGHPLRLWMVSASFAELAALRRGEGAIRLRLEAALPALPPGAHRLLFRNAHLAGHSAYLANALMPESDDVAVTAQRRDRDQSELTIEYDLRGGSTSSALAWVVSRLTSAFRLP